MLELTEPQWGRYKANFEGGARVAELLRQAKDGAPLEGWYDDLFQELCHQYTVSEAAFPALPHLVAIAAAQPSVQADLLLLAAACCTHAGQTGPALPAEHAEDWARAIKAAIPLTARLLELEHPEPELRFLLAALASFHGDTRLAEAIEMLDTLLECPSCGEWIERMAAEE